MKLDYLGQFCIASFLIFYVYIAYVIINYVLICMAFVTNYPC